MGTVWTKRFLLNGDSLVCGFGFGKTIYMGTMLGKIIEISGTKENVLAENLPTINCIYFDKDSTKTSGWDNRRAPLLQSRRQKILKTNIPKGESVVFVCRLSPGILTVSQSITSHGDEHYVNSSI